MKRHWMALAAATLVIPAGAQMVVSARGQDGTERKVIPSTGESYEEFLARTKWWRDAKFGMFIHWGVYAVPADATLKDGIRKGIAEWYFSNKQMQMADYEKFAPQFNPVKFNAREWVRTAKNAGMKYIVITSKHHDGFALWDSKVSKWDVMDATPFKRDILKELSKECKRQGVKLCFYHSIMDWHHPDYLPRRPWESETRPADGADFERYVAYMKEQLRELITRYDPAVLWFDGEWEPTWTHERGADLYKYVRSLKPDILINNRVDKGRAGMAGMTTASHFFGDFGTPEQEIPPTGFDDGRLWESCMTMNDTWGYARNDTNWKSAEDLIHKLCDIAHKGGNFLLNVGPMDTGEFPPAINERLAEMGKWLKANGKAIYGTERSPFKKLPFQGRASRRGNTLYLMVFQWPEEGLTLSGLRTHILSARAVATGQKLNAFAAAGKNLQTPDLVYISKPKVLDKYATVVELNLAGPPAVSESSAAAKPGADGIFTLRAADAEVEGHSARYEDSPEKDCIGFWTNAADTVSWQIETPAAGRYTVEVLYACEPGSEGSEYRVSVEGGPAVTGSVKATGSWNRFETASLGAVEVRAGKRALTVKAVSMPRGAVMNLRCVRLIPAR